MYEEISQQFENLTLSDSYEQALLFFLKSQYEKSLSLLLELSQNEEHSFYPGVCFLLWEIYKKGLCVKKNLDKERFYLEKIKRNISWFLDKSKDDLSIKTMLGILYKEYIIRHIYCYRNAKQCFQEASTRNFAWAQVNLGHFYKEGLLVSVNYQKAKDLYEKAAIQDNSEAQYNLGFLYHYHHTRFNENSVQNSLLSWFSSLRVQLHNGRKCLIGVI